MLAAAAAKKNTDSDLGHFYYCKALSFEPSANSNWQTGQLPGPNCYLLSSSLLITVITALFDQLAHVIGQLALAFLLRQPFKKG